MSHTSKEIVFITGANTGLGFELARQLLTDHAGKFHVLVGSRSSAKGEQAVKDLHAKGLTDSELVIIDNTDDRSITAAAQQIEKKFGKLDVLHVNAAISPDTHFYQAEDPLDPSLGSFSSIINQTMATNVAGSGQIALTFVPLLRKSENPRMIFTSSQIASLSLCASMPALIWPAYSPTKSALNMLMLWLAHKFPEIRVNATNPGYRPTQLNGYGTAAKDVEAGNLGEGVRNAVRLTLLGKDSETGTSTETVDGTGEVKTVAW